MKIRSVRCASGCITLWLTAAAVLAGEPAGNARVTIDGRPVASKHATVAGFWLFAEDDGAQLALMGHPPRSAVASLEKGRQITIHVPAVAVAAQGEKFFRVNSLDGPPAEVTLRAGSADQMCIDIAAPQAAASVRLEGFREGLEPEAPAYPQSEPVASSPALRGAIEQALIEWDWRMQDGIGTPREPRTYAQAIAATLDRGDLLLADLVPQGVVPAQRQSAWSELRRRFDALQGDPAADEAAWEPLWRDVHRQRRAVAFCNPLADLGPVVFVKHVPSTMSHQLTQYYGYEARPGGGVFVLAEPGRSMRVRELSAAMPAGNYLHPEVSFDGRRILFAFCECSHAPQSRRHPDCMQCRYHLWSMGADGSQALQLTDGPYDDFSPKFLPNGKLLFISTRRGGFHRCGGGPCYVYTLALAEADGSQPRPISFHETNEWDPALLHDGRVIYTRWDYVDRNAVFYEHLWTARQDGSQVAAYYGNNTYNPVGTWEARPIPGSNRVMATAAPHHGMTAGSIILLDVARGIDGPAAVTRLTPDALFPEAESGLARGIPVDKPTAIDDDLSKTWGPQTLSQPTRLAEVPAEERRWPGHCYRSPYPLSERYFLAAYSFDRLRGEPGPNRPNMFGLYWCDAAGNKELLYRDPNLSSQWPLPLRPRPAPPVLEMPSHWAAGDPRQPEGTLLLKDVHASWPRLPDVEIRGLRIVQVLPKTTPHINNPRVGAANASPGKQVLGTVPVERDGSAYFRVPARTPVQFQALDAQGRAVQTMRSLVYLQPGEQMSCVGCHEPRNTAASEQRGVLASAREPSAIVPGPAGSRPLSYPLLVQPVLDRHCVACHNATKPEGKIVLTGEPAGTFSRSYNSLLKFVVWSAWGNPANNHEPLTVPDRFGARACKLTQLLDLGHYEVSLSAEEWQRLVTWMDVNALFYGTFNPEQQARQLRGEQIAGPDLE